MIRNPMLAVVLLLIAGSAGAAAPQWVAFTDEFEEARIDVNRSGPTVLEFDVELPGVAFAPVATEGGGFVRLVVPGLGQIGEPGEPALPAFRRFVEIPAGAAVAVDVQVLDKQTIALGEIGLTERIAPVQLPRPKCDCEEARRWRFSFKETAYDGEFSHPQSAVRGPYTFRDHEVMLLTLSPVVYDVENASLEVAQRVRVTVTFEGGDTAKTRARKERLASRHFDAFIAPATVNSNLESDAANWAYPDDAPVEFLIITPPQFVADLAPFIEWKTSTGYNINLATTDDPMVGTTTTSIKNYISGLYNGANPPVYILMIGDSPNPLPTYSPSGGGTGGTDLPFVQMDGDLYPDMMIARWPVDDSTELTNMQDKILFYEHPTAANSAFMNRALFLAGDDYMGRVTTHEDVMAELMEPPPNSAECEIWYGDTQNPTTQQLINDLNSGRGWAVYSAHCGPSGMSGDPPPVS